MSRIPAAGLPYRVRRTTLATAALLLSTVVAGCRTEDEPVSNGLSSAVLRVGVAQVLEANPLFGIRQLSQNLAFESIARIGEDGRMQPALAESWTVSGDGRTLSIKFRGEIKFHDGSRFDVGTFARMLPDALRSLMGPLYADIESVAGSQHDSIDVLFRRPSPFLTELLEVVVRKPASPSIGTGPFKLVSSAPNELHANDDYYLGRPAIATIEVGTYPSVRAAWAEMLRGRLDFLYEVGPDAVDSMRNASTISVFTFTRRYQHTLVFNGAAPSLHSAEVRQALNFAIDRAAIVHNALNDHGLPSTGAIWPHYWGLAADAPQFQSNPGRAAELLRASRTNSLHFTCLVSPDALDERLALEVKRQLASVGVDMSVEQIPRDDIVRRAAAGQYEALITELIGGPTLLRIYSLWHSKAPTNWGQFGNASIDSALDGARYGATESETRAAVARLERAFFDDPPAAFLAWSVRARAVSNRFSVPAPEAGREILSNLRLWKPVDERQSTPN